MMAFNYLNLVEDGPSPAIDCNGKHFQADTQTCVNLGS